ncbi:MAG: hypothetical protein FJ088_11605, partial [Deltaproteobacteria bacterium]|nr:hypothetical protein [Deltaproteobacteria bacterium]
KSGEKFQSVIGEAILGYKFSPTTILELGFERDFSNSFYANYYVMHRGNLKFQQQIMSRVNITGEFAYARLSYSAFSPAGITVNQNERSDNALQGSVNLEFSIARILMFTASYKFESILTDFELTNAGFADYGGYIRHSVFGGLRLLY